MSEHQTEHRATQGTAARQWWAGYQRVSELAAELGAAGLSPSVPACPDWTAQQLLSHMIGVGVDAVAGNAPDDTNPAWTQSHVTARADASVADLLAEWRGQAPTIRAFVAETDPSPLADLLIHEQDLRGAVRRPGAADVPGADLVRDTLLGRLGQALAQADQPLELRATDRDWSWRSTDGEPGTVLAAPSAELFRAITSRRSADELRSWAVRGPVDPYLDAFAGLGPLPAAPLPGG